MYIPIPSLNQSNFPITTNSQYSHMVQFKNKLNITFTHFEWLHTLRPSHIQKVNYSPFIAHPHTFTLIFGKPNYQWPYCLPECNGLIHFYRVVDSNSIVIWTCAGHVRCAYWIKYVNVIDGWEVGWNDPDASSFFKIDIPNSAFCGADDAFEPKTIEQSLRYFPIYH